MGVGEEAKRSATKAPTAASSAKFSRTSKLIQRLRPLTAAIISAWEGMRPRVGSAAGEPVGVAWSGALMTPVLE